MRDTELACNDLPQRLNCPNILAGWLQERYWGGLVPQVPKNRDFSRSNGWAVLRSWSSWEKTSTCPKQLRLKYLEHSIPWGRSSWFGIRPPTPAYGCKLTRWLQLLLQTHLQSFTGFWKMVWILGSLYLEGGDLICQPPPYEGFREFGDRCRQVLQGLYTCCGHDKKSWDAWMGKTHEHPASQNQCISNNWILLNHG